MLLGLVTYRSTNKRHPNNVSIESCLANLAEDVTIPTSLSGRSSSSKRNELSGVALVVLYDADVKARSNNGDTLFLASPSGPYSNIAPRTGVLDGAASYSYATCPMVTGGGVLPGSLVDIVMPTGGMPFEECLRLIGSGDIDIDLVPTTTSLPPETTTTLAPALTTTAPAVLP